MTQLLLQQTVRCYLEREGTRSHAMCSYRGFSSTIVAYTPCTDRPVHNPF